MARSFHDNGEKEGAQSGEDNASGSGHDAKNSIGETAENSSSGSPKRPCTAQDKETEESCKIAKGSHTQSPITKKTTDGNACKRAQCSPTRSVESLKNSKEKVGKKTKGSPKRSFIPEQSIPETRQSTKDSYKQSFQEQRYAKTSVGILQSNETKADKVEEQMSDMPMVMIPQSVAAEYKLTSTNESAQGQHQPVSNAQNSAMPVNDSTPADSNITHSNTSDITQAESNEYPESSGRAEEENTSPSNYQENTQRSSSSSTWQECPTQDPESEHVAGLSPTSPSRRLFGLNKSRSLEKPPCLLTQSRSKKNNSRRMSAQNKHQRISPKKSSPGKSPPKASLLGSPPKQLKLTAPQRPLRAPPGLEQHDNAVPVAPDLYNLLLTARNTPVNMNATAINRAIQAEAEKAKPPQAPEWNPPPISRDLRQQLFAALRADREGKWDGGKTAAVHAAISAVIYREHPRLRVQCVAPEEIGPVAVGRLTIEDFLDGTQKLPVMIGTCGQEFVFVASDFTSQQDMLAYVRRGHYFRGHSVGCFYAHLYAYEFLFFLEYLRQTERRTAEARDVLERVVTRASTLHLIVNSHTLFGLAPDVMFTQRSPFIFIARLFPMQKPWEVDLLCDMINSVDLVPGALQVFRSENHYLRRQYWQRRSSAEASGMEMHDFHSDATASARLLFRLPQNYIKPVQGGTNTTTFGREGSSYVRCRAPLPFAPLDTFTVEQVLRDAPRRHVLLRLHPNTFYVGAPVWDVRVRGHRHLLASEAREHVSVGFFFEAPEFRDFAHDVAVAATEGIRRALRLRASADSSAQRALVRLLERDWLSRARLSLPHAAQPTVFAGPFVLPCFIDALRESLQQAVGADWSAEADQLAQDVLDFVENAIESVLDEHNVHRGDM